MTNEQIKALIQKVLDKVRETTTSSIVYEDPYDYSQGVKGSEVDYIYESADEILRELGIDLGSPTDKPGEVMTLEQCKAKVAKECQQPSVHGVINALQHQLNSTTNIERLVNVIAKEYASQYKQQAEQAQRKLDFYRGEVGKIRTFVFDDINKIGRPNQNIFEAVSDKIKELEQQVKELREALEEISEVTVICGNSGEAFDIVQNIVSHILNGRER